MAKEKKEMKLSEGPFTQDVIKNWRIYLDVLLTGYFVNIITNVKVRNDSELFLNILAFGISIMFLNYLFTNIIKCIIKDKKLKISDFFRNEYVGFVEDSTIGVSSFLILFKKLVIFDFSPFNWIIILFLGIFVVSWLYSNSQKKK